VPELDPIHQLLRRLLPRELPSGELALAGIDPPRVNEAGTLLIALRTVTRDEDGMIIDLREADQLEVGRSRLGGDPDLPPTLAWPQIQGEPLVFVAQLDLAELARYEAATELPRAGLLSFFYAPIPPDGYELEHPVAVLHLRDRDEALALREQALRWRLLLQIDAYQDDELLLNQDGGFFYFWIPGDALAVHDWSRVQGSLQCH
jgi:uncharacterized protein YwqG